MSTSRVFNVYRSRDIYESARRFDGAWRRSSVAAMRCNTRRVTVRQAIFTSSRARSCTPRHLPPEPPRDAHLPAEYHGRCDVPARGESRYWYGLSPAEISFARRARYLPPPPAIHDHRISQMKFAMSNCRFRDDTMALRRPRLPPHDYRSHRSERSIPRDYTTLRAGRLIERKVASDADSIPSVTGSPINFNVYWRSTRIIYLYCVSFFQELDIALRLRP